MGGRADLECLVLQARPEFNKLQPDGFQDAIDILKHFVVRKAQDIEPLCAQCGGARLIVGDFRTRRMRRPIDFDDETSIKACEIGDEGANDSLTSKLESSDLLASYAAP